jgi:sulfur carrier protein
MRIQLNGRPHELASGTTVADLVESVVSSSRGSSAAVDGEVVPRGKWPDYLLRDDQSVELITAVQGG